MKKKTALRRNQKKTFSLAVLLWIIVFALVGVLIAYLYALSGANRIGEILGKRNFWLLSGVVDGLIVIAYLMSYRIDAQNIALNENDLEDTNWLTVKKLKKMKEFAVTDWEAMKDCQDGIVIGAEEKNKGKDKIVEIITTSNLHALIVGTTGSGKTTGFVDQNIAILAKSKEKPSIVISDPKRELYEKHAKQLKSEGYKISVLDLREPYSSMRWNPMSVLIRRIRIVKELKNDIKSKDGRYYGAGEEFLVYDDVRLRVQELEDEIYENARELVYTICPVQNHEQPNWEMGARDLIFGLVLAFCEDCIKGKMEEKQLLLFNVYHNITKYCSEDTTALKAYLLEGRDEYSKVRGLVNTVLVTSDKTLTSYLSEVNGYMQQLADDGILSLTSENDLDIVNMDEEANAVFIIIPDERFTRHRFVTLFVSQVYKELVEKANLNLRRHQTETAILKRNAYFVLDEFGNLPKLENLEGMITVSRARGIRYLFVLQSFAQLTAKYGHDIGDIIKDNCNVKIFIGSGDLDTKKEFSELCGQKKIKNFSVNTSVEHSASSSTGAGNQPLITVGMLERLNGEEKGDAIVSVRGYEPIWARFTPSYKLAHVYFQEGKADAKKREAVRFQKDNYVFDIYEGKEQSEDKKTLEAIEEADKGSAECLNKLDEQWSEIENEINERLRKFVSYLDSKDSRAVLAAKLENKTLLLYFIMEKYSKTTTEKIMSMAEYISSKLPALRKLQEEAIRKKGEKNW